MSPAFSRWYAVAVRIRLFCELVERRNDLMERPRILIVYGTDHGQAAKVAKRVGERLTERGCLVDIRYGKYFNLDCPILHYDGVVMGASLYMQRHQPYVVDFARAYSPFLDEMKSTAFFSVSAAAGSHRESDRRGARECVERFIDRTGWTPDMVNCVGGAINYTQYGPIEKRLMQLIALIEGADTDVSRDYEYTNWDEVDRFAIDYFDSLGVEVAPAPSPEERARIRRQPRPSPRVESRP